MLVPGHRPARFRPSHHENQRQQDPERNAHNPKAVYVRERHRLLLQSPHDQRIRPVSGAGSPQGLSCRVKRMIEIRIER